MKPSDTTKARDRKRKHLAQEGVSYLPIDTEGTINGYKEPLRPVPDGFGYLGALVYDKTEEFTQCHTCGYFYKHLGKHIRQSHAMSSDEYKEEYGLMKGTSLFATNTRTRYVQAFACKSSAEKKKVIQRLTEAARNRFEETGNMAGLVDRTTGKRLEWYNRRGNCPDQIVDKILMLSKKLDRTPGTKDFDKEYGRGYTKAAMFHFGSWKEAVLAAGLTPLPRHGLPWYTEQFLTESLQNFRRMYGRDPFYSDTRTNLLPNSHAYIRVFGSWSKAKEIALNN